MNNKIFFIGAGNMSEGIVSKMITTNTTKKEDIRFFEINDERANYIKDTYGIESCDDVKTGVEECKYIVIAVKPNVLGIVLDNLPELDNNVIISIVAGKSIDDMTKILGEDIKIVRTIPNAFTHSDKGINILYSNDNVAEDEKDFVDTMFGCFGENVVLPESQFNKFSAFGSACCGAFIIEYIDSMIEAGVRTGFSREHSKKFVIASILSVIETMEMTGQHPVVIKNKMCSPAGITIEGLNELYNNKFRATLQNSVEKSVKKANNM